MARYFQMPAIAALFALWLLPASAAPTASFTVHDFLPEFWEFWAAAENQPVERQAQLWQNLYVQKHLAVFDDLAAPCKDEYNSAWAKAHYFPNLSKIVPAMREATAGLPEQLGLAQARFLNLFPAPPNGGQPKVVSRTSGNCDASPNGTAASASPPGAKPIAIHSAIPATAVPRTAL